MEVYKFGGASVQSAEGVKNLSCIVGKAEKPLVVVVSAMGKTTNAMEEVLRYFMEGEKEQAANRFSIVKKYHIRIMEGLGLGQERVASVFASVERILAEETPSCNGYDYWYDRIVSFGEILSTTIVNAYLNVQGIKSRFIDMRRSFITDNKHREANVDYELSRERLLKEIGTEPEGVYLLQGFIGGTKEGESTTLGREGSDYTAAAVANILDCKAVTIWKDVPGILNADPRIFGNTVLIPRLTYVDAVELAYSGAQIIHPKTIKPLQNKDIPLYVRPFGTPEAAGSVIKGNEGYTPHGIPVLILKRDQILISIRPKDFSFVLEESLAHIFALMHAYHQKINLIQSSAIRITLSVDNSRYFSGLLEELQKNYKVKYNDNLELLTIRGYNSEVVERESAGHTVYVRQQTRRSYKLLRESTAER